MDHSKSQAYNFAYEVMPVMFHSQTDEFYTYLERDGVKFLEFWWDYIGKQLPREQLRSFEGVECKIYTPVEKDRFAFIKLPEPLFNGEMYFLGFYSKPERRFAWVRLPNTRIITLTRRTGPDFPYGTELGELTPRSRYVPLGAGPQPDQETFMEIVRNRIALPDRPIP